MNEIRDEIDARVRQFVEDLEELIRRAALEAASEALTNGTAAPAAKAASAPASKSQARASKKAKRSSKRSQSTKGRPGLLDEVYAYIEKNPGSRMEQMRDALDAPSPAIRRQVNKLIADEVVEKKGAKRSTAYFPAGRK